MTPEGSGFRRAWRRRLIGDNAADPPLVIFVVTSTRSDRLAGDWFTALELGQALEKRFGWRWRCIARDSAPTHLAEADIVVHMLHDVDSRTFRPLKPGALVVGWMRNWFNLWPSVSWIDDFDLLLASSERARAFVSAATALPCGLLRIATNPERFAQGRPDPALGSDVLFTGNYGGVPRDLAQSVRPEDWPGRFAIFGRNWGGVASMSAYERGPLPYERMPDAYASTTLVLDDANFVTAPWGSVNSRVFDALGAGRLVLSNGALGVDEIFGDALPTFSGAEELTALVRTYLTDAPARQAKVASLRAMVLAGHTYAHRAEEFRAQIATLVGGLRLSIKTDRETGHPDRGESDTALQIDGQIRALSRALKTRGHMVRVDALGQWTRAAGRLDDAALIVRGEARFPYDLGIPLLIWACSHPTRINPDEARRTLAVFEPGWNDQQTTLPGAMAVPPLAPVPLPPLPRPATPPSVPSVVYVGGAPRDPALRAASIVALAMEAKLPFGVYGPGWDDIVPADQRFDGVLADDTVRFLFGYARVVLIDPLEDAALRSLPPPRFLDAIQAGAVPVCRAETARNCPGDWLRAMEIAESADELHRLVRRLATNPSYHAQRLAVLNDLLDPTPADAFAACIEGIVRRAWATLADTAPPTPPVCPLCGGIAFGSGPGGLAPLPPRDQPVRCLSCGSLERHRGLRQIWTILAEAGLCAGRALQFSPEASVNPQWFTTFEVSVFGGNNHLDLQAIDRPDGAYDWVLCNHVIEHVADDGLAFAELLRVLAPGGVIELTVPDPFSQRLTVDWGFPRQDLHGHYRLYGRDLLGRLFQRTGPLPVFPAKARDPLTGREDLALFLARELQALAPLAALLPRSELALTAL